MEDSYDLYEKSTIAFNDGQFTESAKYFIEAVKKGHPDCIDTLVNHVDVHYEVLADDVLLAKVIDYLKEEFSKLQNAKNKPLKLYFKKVP